MLRWVDGRPGECLPLADRGLAYGDGLFETIAIHQGMPVLLERHLQRLAGGADRLGLPLDMSEVAAELRDFCSLLKEGVAKLVVTRGDGLRGYAPPATAECRRLLIASPRPTYPADHARLGIRLYPCQTRLARQPLLAGLKHLNRLEQVLARAEWSDTDHAEGLMRDTEGAVIEGVFSNLFLVHGDTVITPDLTDCGVAGVMRAELIEQLSGLGRPCAVRPVSEATLLAADEVFVCNSVYGVWPVRSLGERVWPVGSWTRKLQAIACDVLGMPLDP